MHCMSFMVATQPGTRGIFHMAGQENVQEGHKQAVFRRRPPGCDYNRWMISVRPLAEDDDPDAVSSLLNTAVVKYIAADCTPGGLAHLCSTLSVDAIRQRRSSGYVHWLAFSEEALAGVCALKDAHLYHLFVADRFHRQGIGRQLLAAAIAHCLQSGVSVMTVNASTFGVPAYRALGFEENGPQLEKNGIRFQPMRLSLA